MFAWFDSSRAYALHMIAIYKQSWSIILSEVPVSKNYSTYI